MSTVNLTLYNLLKTELKLSDEKAKEFAEALKEEVINDIKNHNQDFKSSMREDFLKLELKMEQNKSELLKWFIGAFLALALMTIGLYIK
ncbi:MAG: hypothetical protein K2Q03_06235 [Sphingobacteriaceae bacterium]|nr:hypothetical protein [Sphingobacteriaceae bacterium]